MIKKILNYAFLAIVLFAVLVLVRTGYDSLDAYNTEQLLNTVSAPIYLHTGNNVAKTEFHAGDVVYLHLESTRPVDCSGVISLRLLSEHIVNDETYRIIYETFGNDRLLIPKGHYILDTRFVIPTYFEKGEYIIERAAHYECGSFSVDKTPRVRFTVD